MSLKEKYFKFRHSMYDSTSVGKRILGSVVDGAVVGAAVFGGLSLIAGTGGLGGFAAAALGGAQFGALVFGGVTTVMSGMLGIAEGARMLFSGGRARMTNAAGQKVEGPKRKLLMLENVQKHINALTAPYAQRDALPEPVEQKVNALVKLSEAFSKAVKVEGAAEGKKYEFTRPRVSHDKLKPAA